MKYYLRFLRGLTLLILLLVVTPITSLQAEKSEVLGQVLLRDTYNELINSAAKIYSQESKELCGNLLKEEKLQKSQTPVIKKFKHKISNFLDLYPSYQRFGLYHELVLIFENIVREFYPQTGKDAESQYILRILKKYNYSAINQKYEQDFLKFFQQKLYTNFEKFSKTVDKHKHLRHDLVNWLENAKNCQKYDCALDLYNSLYDIFYTPKDELFDGIQNDLTEIYSFFTKKSYEIMKLLMKDSNLAGLNPKLQKSFIRDLNDFIQKYETDFNNLDQVFDSLHRNISLKYFKNSKIPQHDQKILKNLLKKYDYVKWQKIHENQLNDFIKFQLPNKLEEFEQSVINKVLDKERPLFDWFQNLKTLKSYEQKLEAFEDLNKINLNICN
ncbi:uncharacterized protein ACRADG_004560 [Cochliomyia hominivorax]